MPALTVVMNPLKSVSVKPRKKRRKMAARKPKTIRVTRRAPGLGFAPTLASTTGGFIAGSLASKAIGIQQKYLVSLGLAILTAFMGRRALGKYTIPVATGMALNGVINYASGNQRLAGLLSDFCRPGEWGESMPLGQTLPPRVMSDYFIQPHMANVGTKNIRFAEAE